MMITGAAFLHFYLPGTAPWALTFVLADALVLLVPRSVLIAYCRLLGVQPANSMANGAVVFGWAGLVATVLDAPAQAAVSTLCLSAALMLAYNAQLRANHALRNRTPATNYSAAVLAITSASLAYRGVSSMLAAPDLLAAGSISLSALGLVVTGCMFDVGGSVGFFGMVHERLRRELVESTSRDGLTGVYTRSSFFGAASSLNLDSTSTRFAVVMVDIDHFKSVNDTFGHIGGDTVLAHAARQIASAVRAIVLVGRYGGEEFCVLLPQATAKESQALADRLVEDARRQSVRLQGGHNAAYTLSVGFSVSSAPHEGTASRRTLAEAIEAADRALYLAKQQGRDRALASAGAHLAPLATDTQWH